MPQLTMLAVLLFAGIAPQLCACSSAPKRWDTLPQPPVVASSSSPTTADLTGVYIEAGEPAAVMPPQRCDQSAEYWSIEQRGDSVQAEYRGPNNYRSGIRGRIRMRAYEFAVGKTRDGIVRLRGHYRAAYMDYGQTRALGPNTKVPPKQKLAYELTFDDKTHHLVGTRNGQPIRLAPLQSARCNAPKAPQRNKARSPS
jgi:hypothetical protein